jgi:hypothetical protein
MGWMPAAAAAAKRRRNEKQEREIIERLSREDVGARLEFKILRSYGSVFSNEEKTRSLLDRESRAGWELAARLDSSRLVLRRPVARRNSDAELRSAGLDPYRSVVDPEFPLIIVGVVVVVIIAAPLLGQSDLASTHKILGLAAVIAAAVAVAALIARRR